MVEKRFKVLRFVGGLSKVLAWITLIAGIIIGIVLFVATLAGSSISGYNYGYNSGLGGIITGAGILGALMVLLSSILSGLALFVVFFGSGEMIFLQLAIEENTRAVANAMKD